MKTICAWCGRTINQDTKEPVKKISHGICLACEKKENDKMDRMIQNKKDGKKR